MIALEHLADGSVSDRNFQALMRLVLDTGGQSVGARFGSNAVTFTASATSNTVGVTHGLGRLPVACFVSVGTANNLRVGWSSLSSTGFNVTGHSAIGAVSGDLTFSWLVIG